MAEGKMEDFRLGHRIPFVSERPDFWRLIGLLAYAIKSL
tara:strand:- start:2028 stop:2144 length:117 start_codon:yes stop_codon:yes gene_type:complete